MKRFDIDAFIGKFSPRTCGVIAMILIALMMWKYLLFMICSLLAYFAIL